MRCRSHSSSAKEIAKILSGIRPSLSGLKLKKIVTDAAIQRFVHYCIITELLINNSFVLGFY